MVMTEITQGVLDSGIVCLTNKKTVLPQSLYRMNNGLKNTF